MALVFKLSVFSKHSISIWSNRLTSILLFNSGPLYVLNRETPYTLSLRLHPKFHRLFWAVEINSKTSSFLALKVFHHVGKNLKFSRTKTVKKGAWFWAPVSVSHPVLFVWFTGFLTWTTKLVHWFGFVWTALLSFHSFAVGRSDLINTLIVHVGKWLKFTFC